MKKTVLFLAMLGIFSSMYAQYPVWSDDFNDGDANGWTLVDVDADGFNWAPTGIINENYEFDDDSEYQVLSSYMYDTDWNWLDSQDNWAVSPEISLEVGGGYYYGGTVTLSLNAQLFLGGTFKLYVYASTAPDYSDLEGTFEEIGIIELHNPNHDAVLPLQFDDYDIDLTDFINDNSATSVYFAIRHHPITYPTGFEINTFTVDASELVTSGTKEAQTIQAFSNITKTVGDDDFELTATASSGLVVTYASSNTAVATISGSTVTIVGAGTTTITASQAGNDTYAAAPDVTATLTVNEAAKLDQTISGLSDMTKTVGDADFDLTATASSGLAVTYASSNASVATINGSTVTIVGAGSTTITASQAGSDNYNAATDVTATLTVELSFEWLEEVTIAVSGNTARVAGPADDVARFTKFYVNDTETPLTNGQADLAGQTGEVSLKATTADGAEVIKIKINKQ